MEVKKDKVRMKNKGRRAVIQRTEGEGEVQPEVVKVDKGKKKKGNGEELRYLSS